MRLIDADELKKKFGYTDEWYKSRTVAHEIDNAPTVEPYSTYIISGKRFGKREEALKWLRPKGEWIIDDEGSDSTCTLVTCPFCKERMCCKMNFCGNCGADMRGNKE